MKKSIISVLLVLVMLFGMLPTAAFAADSVEEALGEIDIYNGGVTMSYLSINGRNRELIYTYYNYIDRNGQTREIPAYCVNPNITGVPQSVPEGESIKYIAEQRGSDPKVVGIVANGYPTRGLQELGLENKYHAYYATKMALWCYLLSNWDINNLKVNPSLTGVELQRANQILRPRRTFIAGAPRGRKCSHPALYPRPIRMWRTQSQWMVRTTISRSLPSHRRPGYATISSMSPSLIPLRFPREQKSWI